MTTALLLEEVKSRQQKTWSSGDQRKIACPDHDAVTCHDGKSALDFPAWKVTAGKTI
jgi:hypothetical protein